MATLRQKVEWLTVWFAEQLGWLSSVEECVVQGYLRAPQRESWPPFPAVATTPPRPAGLILSFLLPRKHQEEIVGDLQEEYRAVVLPKIGRSKANLWYWAQCLGSIVPILATAITALWASRLASESEIRSMVDDLPANALQKMLKDLSSQGSSTSTDVPR